MRPPRLLVLLLSGLLGFASSSCNRNKADEQDPVFAPGPAATGATKGAASQAAKGAASQGPKGATPAGAGTDRGGKRSGMPGDDGSPGVSRPLSGLAGPVALSTIDGGVMMLSTWPAERGRTEIDWRRLSPSGVPGGATKVLHTVPGKVIEIAAVPVIDRSVMAWCSETEKGAVFFGVLWVNDWGGVEGKSDLPMEDHAPCHLALLRDQRAAILVHMTGQKEPCGEGRGAPAGDGKEADLCPSVIVHRLAPNANPVVVTDFRLEHHRSAEDLKQGPDADLRFSAVSTDRSILVLANVHSLAQKPQIEAALLTGPGEPGMDTFLVKAQHDGLFWTGSAALIVGHSSRLAGKKAAKEALGAHATLWQAQKLGGDTNGRDEWSNDPWPRITRAAVHCDGAALRVEVSGERGLRAVLDPAAEGASFSLAQALSLVNEGATRYGAALWTGSALLTWDPVGLLVKRSCDNGTIDLAAGAAEH